MLTYEVCRHGRPIFYCAALTKVASSRANLNHEGFVTELFL